MKKWRAGLALGVLCLLPALAFAQGGPQVTISSPYGTIKDGSPASIGSSSVQVLAAVPNGGQRTALFIQLNTANATLTCNSNGAAVLSTHPGITITGQYATLNYANLGAIPNTAVQCVADAPARDITVLAFPQ